MSKVLIWSDAHIHPHKKSHGRLQDCLDTVQWMFDTAKNRKIQNIIFCGDLFHDRQKIDVYTYQKTFEVFQKNLGVSCPPTIYLLLGNHDLWHYEKWDISSVFPLAAIPGVVVVDRPSCRDIAGHEICFLPYTHDPEEDLKKIKSKAPFKILCGHVAIDGAVWNVMAGTIADVSIEHDGDMQKVTAEIFKDYDQVFLGHYHAEQKLNEKVEYVGSPLQLSFGEAFQKKHIIIYDLETHEKEYVRNTFSPEHYPIPMKDVSKYKLENNFIRLMVDDITSSNIIEMKNELAKQNLGSLEIKQAPKKVEEETKLIADAKSILSRGEEMLEKYVDAADLKGLDKPQLLEVGRSIYELYQGED